MVKCTKTTMQMKWKHCTSPTVRVVGPLTRCSSDTNEMQLIFPLTHVPYFSSWIAEETKLENTWVFWEHVSTKKSSSRDYLDLMKPIGEFSTVEDFWKHFNNLPKPRWVMELVLKLLLPTTYYRPTVQRWETIIMLCEWQTTNIFSRLKLAVAYFEVYCFAPLFMDR